MALILPLVYALKRVTCFSLLHPVRICREIILDFEDWKSPKMKKSLLLRKNVFASTTVNKPLNVGLVLSQFRHS